MEVRRAIPGSLLPDHENLLLTQDRRSAGIPRLQSAAEVIYGGDTGPPGRQATAGDPESTVVDDRRVAEETAVAPESAGHPGLGAIQRIGE